MNGFDLQRFAADPMFQGYPIEIFHRDEGLSFVLPNFVDRAVNRPIDGENLSSSMARILRAVIFFFSFSFS